MAVAKLDDPLADEFDEGLEVFFGGAADALARVYARFRDAAGDGRLRLVGTLRGPSCLYAETLPAEYRLADQGPGPSLLAAAVVPEPCFWTPDMPHTYTAELRLEREGQIVARARRTLGIRPLGARGRDLLFDGKRWVLRGVLADEVSTVELAEWHEAATAMVTRGADETLAEAASRVGVLIVAELDGADAQQVQRLARWPAAGLVVMPRGMTAEVRRVAGNLLLAERFERGESVEPAEWTDVVLVEVDAAADDFAARTARCGKPAIALRPAGRLPSIAAGRAACDQVQRDLAGDSEPAGYIV